MKYTNENMQIDAALLDAHRRFEQAQTATGCGIWNWDMTTGLTHWSPELFVLFDRDPVTFEPGFESWRSTIYTEDLAAVNKQLEIAIRDKKMFNTDYRIVRSDGEVRWINTIGQISFDKLMQPVHMTGICIDISERKNTETAQLKADVRFKNALDSLIEGCMILGFDWSYLYLNDTAAKHGNNTREFLIGRNMLELYHGVETTPLFARYKRCMEERIPQRFEESFTFANGKTSWYAFSVDPIPEGIFVLSLDISASKQAEGLRNIHNRIINTTRDGFWMTDMNGNLLEANQAYADMTGYSIAELVKMHASQLDALDDQQKVKARAEIVVAQGQDFFESQHRHKNGHLIDIEVSAHYLADQQKFFAFFRDISMRKQAEAETLAVKNQLQATLDAIPDLMFEIDLDGRYHACHALQTGLLAAPAEMLIGKTVHEVLPPAAAEMVLLALREAYENGVSQGKQIELQLEQGSSWFELSVSHKKEITGVEPRLIVLSRDITKRKLAENMLQFHSNILTGMAAGIFLTRTSDGNIVYTNPQFDKMFGYEAEELVGKHVSIVNAHTEISAKLVANKINSELEKKGLWSGEVLNIKKDGTPFWCQVSIVTMHHPEFGEIWVASHSDITQSKKLQRELKSSLEFSNKLIASMQDGVVVLDKDGIIQDVNAALCQVSGFSRDELIGSREPFPYWPPEECENIRVAYKKALAGEVDEIDVTLMRKNGERFPAIVSPAPIRNESGGIINYMVTIKDISELKAAEMEIQIARKAINRDLLVREVHHRIKNNLQGITGILRVKASAIPELSETIQQVIGQIHSVAVIHGLHGRTGMSQVRLCELTSAIAAESEKLWHTKIAVDIPSDWIPFIVHESESVPVALILHELIANAIKHSQGRMVSIKFAAPSPYNVIVTVQNMGSIPAGFGVHNPKMFGTGLQLVSSLLPPEGVKLYWEQQDEMVITNLKVYAPVVQLEMLE